MKKFKLVLADHDGTIVNDNRVLSDRKREALEEHHREGYLFGMASGRTVEDVNHYPQRWGLSFDFDCVIGLGGCQFYPTAKAEWDQVKQGVIAAEQNALTGADIQAELDALQAELVG